MALKNFDTKIDSWMVASAVLILVFALTVLLLAGVEWYIVLILGILSGGIMSIGFLKIHYVIKDDMLGVKSGIIWRWYPIENIEKIWKATGFLVAPATSFKRVVIKFKGGTTPASFPLEISPKNPDQFIAELIRINPNIDLIE